MSVSKVNKEILRRVKSILNAYDIDHVNGFLRSSPPLQYLPLKHDWMMKYKIWEDVMSDLPQLLVAQSFKRRIETMATICDISEILSSQAPVKRRALSILSMFASAFINEEQMLNYNKNRIKPKPRQYLPESIAIPLYPLCVHMSAPPIITSGIMILNNYRLLFPSDACDDDDIRYRYNINNIALNNLFLGGLDEHWFALIAAGVEALSGPILTAMLSIQEIIKIIHDENCIINHIMDIQHHLNTIVTHIEEMKQLLLRYDEKLDADIFYHRVRPLASGCVSMDDFPNGVELKGIHKSSATLSGCIKVENNNTQCLCLRYHGASNAQSSIFPVLDHFLDVDQSMDVFLNKMLQYMPFEHREFIHWMKNETLSMTQCIEVLIQRDVGNDNISNIKTLYNDCILKLKEFRTVHLKVTVDYVVVPGSKTTDTIQGTGGSTVIPYLKSIRDRTSNSIKQST